MGTLTKTQEVVTTFELPYRQTKANGTFNAGNNTYFRYTKLELYSNLGLKMFKGDLVFEFGCQTFGIEFVKSALNQLNGAKTTVEKKVLVLKSTGKGRISSPVIEETDKYFITANMKAYNKADYKRDTVSITKNPISGKSGYYRVKGYSIYPSKAKFIEKLEYLVEIYDKFHSAMDELNTPPVVGASGA